MAAIAGMTAVQMFTAAMAVTSIALSISTMMQGRPSFQQSDMGTNVNRKGADNPNIVAFGNTIVPAVQVWNKVSTVDSKYLVEVHSLGHGPFKSIKNVYIDNQPLFGITGNDLSEKWLQATQGGFNNVSVGIRRGNHLNQTWQEMIINSGGEWTSACRGDGIANLSFKIERPEPSSGDVSVRVLSDKFAATALVEGVPVIDPRVDTMLLGWSDSTKRNWVNGNVESYRNPACALLTYLADREFGFRLDPDMVDIQSFIALANWCDLNKITLDGYIDQGSTFGDIVNNFASSWGGSVYLVGGKISVSAETASVVRFNITEDDLVDTISLTNNKSDYFNTIKIDFQNKTTDFAKDSFVLPKDSLTDDTIREDGRIIEKTIDCPLSTDPSYIKYIANRELKRAKLCRKEITISVLNTSYPLEMGDVFTVTEKMYDLDASTKWRVTKLDNTLDDKTLVTKVTAQEYDARIYDKTEYNDGNLSSLKPTEDYTVLPVSSLKFVQNTSHNVGSGTLSWNTNYYSDARYVVQYRLTGTTEWQTYGQYPSTSIIMTNLQTGRNYDFRVRVVASIGGSSWTSITNQKVNKSISLPRVSNLACDFTSPDAIITFSEINSPVSNNSVIGDGITNLSQLVAYYQVTINGKIYRASNGRYVYSHIANSQNGMTRNLNISVCAVSIYGDQGEVSSINARNEPIGQPASVDVKSQLVNLTVSWLNPSDLISDYLTTDIWITANKTAPTASDLVASSNIGFWTAVRAGSNIKKGWVWIAHRDVFGYDGIPPYSVPVYFEETSIDDLLTGSEFESNVESIENNLNNAQQDITKAKTDILTNASEINTVKNTVSAQGVQITNVQIVANSNTGKIASLETELSAAEADLDAKITTNKNAITTTNQAMTSMDTRLTSAVGSNTSAIQQQGIAISNLDSSLSLYKTENTAEVNGVKSSVTAISQAQASTDGKVNSLYTLRVDANGKVAGMSLGATPQGSTVDFLSDTFRIANSTTGTPATVFEVRGGNTMIKNAFIGNLVASQISADAINGSHIAANSIIQAGSGATSATLNGSDANWRIYAGSTTPGSAPFRVSTTGGLVATNANISGVINATSGSFSGAITASSGSISGRLTMNGGFIDGRSGQDSINLGNGSFRVDNSGNLYASNGTFGGTIYADKISGDIVNAGLFTFPATSQIVTSGTLHDVFRMNVPAVGWERYMLISRIPLSWRSLENGGRFNMFLRDSTGRNTNIFGENKPMGTIDGYPSLDNFSIRIPANATWVALSIQGDRRQSVGFGQLPIESNWQVFKAGSGGISITV